MRIVVGFCLILLFSLGLLAQSPKMTVYRDSKFPFTITYDGGEWEVVQSS